MTERRRPEAALPEIFHQTRDTTSSGTPPSATWTPPARQVYANLESFVAVLAAAVMLGEHVEWTSLVGGVAVAGGVLLTRRHRA